MGTSACASALRALLRERNAQDIVFLAGGFIPPEDIPRLKAFGVREVFRDGAKLEEIVQFIEKVAAGARRGIGHDAQPTKESQRWG